MSRKDELKDRLMDELLCEDARGEAADEKMLAAVEAAIDGEVEDGKVTPIREGRSRAPYAWAAAITVSAASVIGFLGWKASQPENKLDELAMRSGPEPRTIMPEVGEPAGSRGAPKKPPLGRYSNLWTKSPHTVRPPAAEPAELGPVAARDEFASEWEQREGLAAATAPDASPPTESSVNESLPSGVTRMDESETLLSGVARTDKRETLPPVVGRAKDGGLLVDGVPLGTGSAPVPLRVPLSNQTVSVDPFGDLSKGRRGVDGIDPEAIRPVPDEPRVRHAPPVSRENYGQLVDQPWKAPTKDRFSTFSVDVDTASYANIRRMLQQGARVPADAVRIEECINYFDYRYEPPTQGGPFAVHVDMATCPWAGDHRLMKVGLKGMEVATHERPASNLVFLIDVSGSMQGSKKLPLLVESMKVLVEELDERDRVGIVVYAGSEGVVLEPTHITQDGRGKVLAALNNLRAGGSTNGGAGITRAYSLAQGCFVEGGTNRVILATDGDFNVGTTGQGDLVTMVKDRAQSGVFLSVLGFGSGNINDAMLEAITNNGNGNYHYIDSQKEGRKVFLNDLSGTLVTIAKDVKIQVDFNPGKVQAYRLIGYANRILRDEDFNNDKIDAGDIGAGHTVTALYEIVPAGAPSPAIGGVDGSKYDQPAPARDPVASDEWLTVKLRYKRPDGDTSTKLEVPVAGEPVAWEAANGDFQFAAGVALFGMKLRQSGYVNDAGWDLVRELARRGSAHDLHGYRAEFRTLVEKAAGGVNPPPVRPGVEAPRAE